MIEVFKSPKDLKVSIFSTRFGKTTEIGIDDIEDIYSSTSLTVEESVAVRKVIDRIKRVCLSDRIGTFEFCVAAKDSLVDLDSRLKERSLKIRKSVHKRVFSGSGRQVDVGAQYRAQILTELEDAIEDVSNMAKMLEQ